MNEGAVRVMAQGAGGRTLPVPGGTVCGGVAMAANGKTPKTKGRRRQVKAVRKLSERVSRLKTRALAPERTLARVCREAGATVRCRDMNLAVAANDDRAIEVLSSRLPLFFGARLAVYITVRSAVAVDGTAQQGADSVDGTVCIRAPEDKERTYSELLRLVVVAVETGGNGVRKLSSLWKAWPQ